MQKPTVSLRSMMARSRKCCTMAPLAGKTIEVNENAEADEFHARSVPNAILLARHTSYKHRDESRARFLRAFHTARAVCKLSLPESCACERHARRRSKLVSCAREGLHRQHQLVLRLLLPLDAWRTAQTNCWQCCPGLSAITT